RGHGRSVMRASSSQACGTRCRGWFSPCHGFLAVTEVCTSMLDVGCSMFDLHRPCPLTSVFRTLRALMRHVVPRLVSCTLCASGLRFARPDQRLKLTNQGGHV